MATVVFDNGNSTGIWSDAANWVGDSLPAAGDVADINENCILDMDDIVAQIDIASDKTLTMGSGGAPYDITGMTASCLGTGTISMLAGCELKWNATGAFGTGTVNITARGTSWSAGAFCTINNVHETGRFDIVNVAASWDLEFTDVLSVTRFFSSTTSPLTRLVNVNIEGGKPGTSTGTYVIIGSIRHVLDTCWVSNFSDTTGAFWAVYGMAAVTARNLTLGRDREGNAQANAVDFYLGHVYAASTHLSLVNTISTAATAFNYATAGKFGSRLIIDNWQFNPKDGTPGTPGVCYYRTTSGIVERSATNPPSGKTYHARLTPSSIMDVTAEDKRCELWVYVPVISGDDISVTAKASRSTTDITAACADCWIDPEGAWYAGTAAVAWDLTNADTYYDLPACTASTAGGTGAKGTVRVIFRLKEYSSADFLDIGDVTITCGGTAYVVSMQNWANGMPVVDEPVASAAGGGRKLIGALRGT